MFVIALPLRTLVILIRFCNWVSATAIRHFVNRNYYNPLTFRNCCVTFQRQFTPSKCCAWGRCLPFPPGYATVFKTESCLLQVVHTVKYTEVEPSYKKLQKLSYLHILQNKNRSCTCSEMLNPVPYFYKHSIHS